MDKEQKVKLFRIILVAALMVILHFMPVEGTLRFVLYMIPYLIIGYDIIIEAFEGILHKEPFDEHLLMVIATAGAIGLGLYSSGDYSEAVAVMWFYQIGEFFEDYAVDKSRKNITSLMDIRPDYANVEKDGRIEKVNPDTVPVGSVIVVKPGEKVPIDGVVVEGTSRLNTSALTGESVPRKVEKDDDIVSGCINQDGLLRIRTTKNFGESTVSKILELVENASSKKAKAENFITKFARVYTPVVVCGAVLLAVLPPLIRTQFLAEAPLWSTWIYRALIVLVISCPCALVISIPLSFFAGIGGASRSGILIKGGNYMETLSKVRTIVFDKTGTLTKGTFQVTAVHPRLINQKELLHLAAHVERYSTHPIAASLRAAYPNEHDSCSVEDVEEIAGKGVRARVNGHTVCVGNEKMMDSIGVSWKPCHKVGTVIHVAMDGKYVGHIVISDVIKPHSKKAIAVLKRMGIRKTEMLTGDAENVAEDVGRTLGLDKVYSGLLPADKVAHLEDLLKHPKENGKVAFVGDGINDAPVLTRADIGISMGALGSDAAIEAADVVLMDDDPLKIATAIRIARKCLAIVYENTWFAIGVKVLCMILGAVGIANMWMAIFADVGVMVLAVLNALRCLFVKGVEVELKK